MSCPVEGWARARPAAPAIVFRGAELSYEALDGLVGRLQALLRALGAPRVVAMGESSPQTVALVHAAAREGVAVALLNTRLTAAEVAPLEEAVQPAARIHALDDAAAGAGHGLARDEAAARNGALEAAAQPAATDDAARAHSLEPGRKQLRGVPELRGPVDSPIQLLLFTSGTTGRPKAAQLTVANLRANAAASNAALGAGAGSRFLCCLPLFHVGGIGLALRAALCGGSLLLHERFDAEAVAGALLSATHASLVASTLARVLDARDDFHSAPLRAVLVGGGPVPKRLLERARRAGLPVLQTYGLTEACSQVTCELPGEADGATAGVPLPATEVRIVDGEIEVRGPTVMRGYLGSPPLSEADGWFRTGDLGELDARGRLVVHARRNDLIVSGGENVYPAEVEAALAEHPEIAEVAVVPAADERWGQVGCAFVVRRPPTALVVNLSGIKDFPPREETTSDLKGSFPEDLAAFLRPRLAGYKHPRHYRALPALPRTAAGKVDRQRLRAMLLEQLP